MKLNNKGFAISSIMYIILIMAVILISVTLAILSSRKLILDKVKKETTDNIYGISYNSVISTLKYEAISYAINNNIEQENIKIGDFETSVSQELLEHHELLDKYLTLYKNNYGYDVYLGQTKKITDISKPIDNMIGIVDYKIEGNSYQETYTGKNLFDISEGITITESKSYLENNFLYTKYSPSNSLAGYFNHYIEVTPNHTYTYNHDYVGGDRVIIMIYDENKNLIKDSSISIGNDWTYNIHYEGYFGSGINHNIIIPENCKYIRFAYCGMNVVGEGNLNSYYNIQIEEGSSATSYEPYVGGMASPNPDYPQEIESVGDYDETTGKYQIPVKVSGKNLFDISNMDNWILQSTYYYYTIFVGANNTVTISWDNNLELNQGLYVNIANNSADKGTQSGKWLYHATNSSLCKQSIVINADEEGYIYININNKKNITDKLQRLQVEFGSTATEYEPYVEPITTNIYLDEPLRKIDDSKDSLNFKNSNVSKKIKRVDLISASKIYTWSNKNGVYFENLLDNRYIRNLNSLSNRNIIFDIDTKSPSSMWVGVGNNYIYWIGILDVLGLNTLEELNEWLKENPTHVLYATDLEPTNISTTLPTIQTNIGATKIEVDTSIQPSNVEFTIIEKIRKL